MLSPSKTSRVQARHIHPGRKEIAWLPDSLVRKAHLATALHPDLNSHGFPYTRFSDTLHFVGIIITGTAFSLRGTTSPSAGRFTVNVDGETTTLSGQSSFTNPDALLYFISGMNASMTHDILIMNDEDRDLTVLSEGFIVSASGDTS